MQGTQLETVYAIGALMGLGCAAILMLRWLLMEESSSTEFEPDDDDDLDDEDEEEEDEDDDPTPVVPREGPRGFRVEIKGPGRIPTPRDIRVTFDGKEVPVAWLSVHADANSIPTLKMGVYDFHMDAELRGFVNEIPLRRDAERAMRDATFGEVLALKMPGETGMPGAILGRMERSGDGFVSVEDVGLIHADPLCLPGLELGKVSKGDVVPLFWRGETCHFGPPVLRKSESDTIVMDDPTSDPDPAREASWEYFTKPVGAKMGVDLAVPGEADRTLAVLAEIPEPTKPPTTCDYDPATKSHFHPGKASPELREWMKKQEAKRQREMLEDDLEYGLPAIVNLPAMPFEDALSFFTMFGNVGDRQSLRRTPPTRAQLNEACRAAKFRGASMIDIRRAEKAMIDAGHVAPERMEAHRIWPLDPKAGGGPAL